MVLALLLFSAHVLLNLWARSTVHAVAVDAALTVATSGARTPAERTRAERNAIDAARRQLGSYATTMSMEFDPSPPGGDVVLQVRGPGLSVVPGAATLGIGPIDLAVRMPSEPLG